MGSRLYWLIAGAIAAGCTDRAAVPRAAGATAATGRVAPASSDAGGTSPDDDELPANQLPPDALAAFAPRLGGGQEHVAPDFGGGDFGITLVEPPGDLRSPPVEHFARPLAIPPVLAPTFRGEKADFYDMHQSITEVQILPGPKTTVYAYAGQFPGPTIVATLGRPVVVRQHNDLPEPVAVHLHGSRTPPSSDGHPTQLIPPGASRDYYYPNPPDKPASTLWYHDHAMDVTGPHVYKGLAGFYLLRDPIEDRAFPLPSGACDVPLVIQDRLFSRTNQFLYPPFEHNGVYGDTILVNGVPYPYFRVATRKYRFRILNGSNARTYQLALSDGGAFTYVGTGAGLVERPLALRTIQVPVADRAEIVIDFARYPVGSSVRLLNLAGRLPGTVEVMRFDVTERATSDTPPVPDRLRSESAFGDASLVSGLAEQRFEIERRHGFWVINGKIFDPNRIDAVLRIDAPSLLTFVNKSGGWVHPIHLHLGESRILDRNGIPAQSSDLGFRDVFLLHENETVRVLFEGRDFAGRYVFHCHNLEHEDMRMMGNFLSVGRSSLPAFVPDLFPFPLEEPPEGPTPAPGRRQ